MSGVWYEEMLYPEYGQRFQIDRVLFENKTGHQHLIIFENARFGHVMALDGIIQTTQHDEPAYHEMLAHVPLFAHGAAKRVLIIGGGDGGILREVLRHPEVERATMVEIDAAVVEMCRKYFPGHSDGAFDDPRTQLEINDAAAFIKTCREKFDVIISDSTDPVGPGEALFQETFYAGCRRCLAPGGVLVTQNGVAFMQMEEVKTTYMRLKPHFADVGFYVTAVPTYIGGFMTLAWATDDAALRDVPLQTLQQRFSQSRITTQYYTPEIHRASFALPNFIRTQLDSGDLTQTPSSVPETR